MSSLKRARNDKNIPPENQGSTTSIQPQLSGIFRNGLKWRHVVRKDVTEEELRILREKRAAEEAKEMADKAEKTQIRAEAEEAARVSEEQTRLRRIVSAITDSELGYGTLYEFLDVLVNTKDRAMYLLDHKGSQR